MCVKKAFGNSDSLDGFLKFIDSVNDSIFDLARDTNDWELLLKSCNWSFSLAGL